MKDKKTHSTNLSIMKKSVAIAIGVILVALVLSLVVVRYYWTIQRIGQVGYWTLNISPTLGPDLVTPNGTIRVPLIQTGINVTAIATGINGFMGWVLDGRNVPDASSTIFVPKQNAFSNHTLEAKFVLGTPPIIYSSSLVGINIPESNGILNTSQGETIQVNLTLTSMTSEQITVPVEDLLMTYYNATIDYSRWVNAFNNYSLLQAEAFNYSFSLNRLTLQPNLSNSTIITINVAENAPLGQYFFFIDFGNIIGGEFSYSGTTGLGIVITPNAEQPSPSQSPTPTPRALYENLTFSNVTGNSLGIGDSYNWTLTFTLTNTGNKPAIIDNITIDGHPYNSYDPVPAISPSIENGYSLLPNQSVKITMKETNSTSQPFHENVPLNVFTQSGNSYSYYFGS
jgi:hypothetical protein